jgi:hypothetical protein
LALAFLLAFWFSSCDSMTGDSGLRDNPGQEQKQEEEEQEQETEKGEEEEPPSPDSLVLEGGAAAVNALGKVRLDFSSDRDGTWYVLILPGGGDAPSAEALTAGPSASGSMTEGQNTLSLEVPEPGIYSFYIAAKGPGGILSEVLTIPDINAVPFTGIAGTQWYMGEARLSFGTEGKASFHGADYDFTWDAAALTGWVAGDKYRGGFINAPGDFTLDTDDEGFITGITFVGYRETDIAMTFSPERRARDPASLAGTLWGTVMVLEFLPNGEVLQFNTTGYYPRPNIYSSYTFDPEYVYPGEDPVEIGVIASARRAAGAATALGAFIIMYDFETSAGTAGDCVLYFPGPESKYFARRPFNGKGYKEYKHRFDHIRQTDD